MTSLGTCPICKRGDAEQQDGGESIRVRCRRCGEYAITGTAVAVLDASDWDRAARVRASSYIFENPGIRIDAKRLTQLSGIFTPDPDVRALRLLRHLARNGDHIGQQLIVEHNGPSSEPFMAASWSDSADEISFLLVNCLADSGQVSVVTRTFNATVVSITGDGYRRLKEAERVGTDSPTGFVAMWFDEQLDNVWLNGIKPGIEGAGYEALRIDTLEHANKIDDEIIANIRKAQFVVADFTGQRGGVYYEAGFAQGLGLPVIWTVRDCDLVNIHFDNRQYNFIQWSGPDLKDFAKRLCIRIESICGHGPMVRAV
jgi:nucleoside 2-deoxyribosyltransferase